MQATTINQPQVTAGASAVSPALTIDRAAGLSRGEFIRRHRDPKRPVILTDAIKDWPALAQFTFDFFKRTHGGRTVVIGNKKYLLGDFIDLLLQSTPQKPAPYPCKLNLRGLRGSSERRPAL